MKRIRIPVFGGLGNQMFQVAHALDLSRRTGQELRFFDLASVSGRADRKWELDCFGIPSEALSGLEILPHRARIASSRWLRRLSPALHLGVYEESSAPGTVRPGRQFSVCAGYWQGQRFFERSIDRVRKTFVFPEISSGAAEEISRSGERSVAVHVRRGDYVSDPVSHAYHFVCDENWYRTAIDRMRGLVPGAAFFVFSDDHRWVQNRFSGDEDVTIVSTEPATPAWRDMALLSRCRHFVISNSSYSWWGAFLGREADSRVIAPEFWFRNVPTRDLAVYCPYWKLV